jgi:acetyl-CoA C-acetyltransferase
VLCDDALAKERGWRPLAYIAAGAAVGCDPATMGLGPVHATRIVTKKLGAGVETFDTVEINEAFAAQAIACARELKLDGARLNPDGGAIALGHPIGTSGARLVTHAAHRLARGDIRSALATLCVGGGMGAAIALRAD